MPISYQINDSNVLHSFAHALIHQQYCLVDMEEMITSDIDSHGPRFFIGPGIGVTIDRITIKIVQYSFYLFV